jgi:ribonuclease HI
MTRLDIYTDGGCRPNPGTGAWAFAYKNSDDFVIGISGKVKETNSNEMELLAVLKALRYIGQLKESIGLPEITFYTDSKYVFNGVTLWYKAWERKGFVGVAHARVWKALISEIKKYPSSVDIKWVKSHGTNQMNNFVDALCTATIKHHQ